MLDDPDRIVAAILAATFFAANRLKNVTEGELINTYEKILTKIEEIKIQEGLSQR